LFDAFSSREPVPTSLENALNLALHAEPKTAGYYHGLFAPT
jgi:hypothetical protein